ncbi:MAG: TSPc protein [Ignavibacteria bacterium]|nr:TSPc protein [Ignavibacteria bacterium]
MKKIVTMITPVIAILFFALNAVAQPLIHPYNLDFEDGEAGGMPVSWKLPSYADKAKYKASLTTDNPYSGKLCLEINRTGNLDEEGLYGSVMQSIDATQYQGKKVRFNAYLRAKLESLKGSAELWIRQFSRDDKDGYLIRSEDKPVVINQWTKVDIEFVVEPYYEFINFGFLLFGNGSAWIDSASFEIIPESDFHNQAQKELTKNESENLCSFAKLFGDIRYFYPGTEASSVNWDDIAMAGADFAGKIDNRADWLDALNKLFEPVAPALQIFKTDEPAPKPILSGDFPNALQNIKLAYWQSAVGLAAKDSLFRSKVVNIYNPQREREGTVIQNIDTNGLAGKHIKFSVYARIETDDQIANAQAMLLAETPEKGKSFFVGLPEPIKSNKWKQYSFEAVLPNNITALRLGLALTGEGKAYFDNISLNIIDSNKKSNELKIRNSDIETGSPAEGLKGWLLLPFSKKAGYFALCSSEKPYAGKQCLLIESGESSRVIFPSETDVIKGELNDNLSYQFPSILAVDSLQSLPYPKSEVKLPKNPKPSGFIINGNDRLSRLAITIITWNIFRNFHTFKSDLKQWDEALETALKKAATDKDEFEFLNTLKLMSALLKDAQARVWQPKVQQIWGLPLLWQWIENQLVITKSADSTNGLHVGDIVSEIDSKPVINAMNEKMKYISGSNNEWKRLRSLAELRTGNWNSTIELTAVNPSGETNKVKVTRNVKLSDVLPNQFERAVELDSGVVYIDMTRTTDEEFKTLVKDLSKARGIIFDIRGISLLSEHTFDFFIRTPLKSVEWRIPIFTKPAQELVSYKKIKGELRPMDIFIDTKIVFLADERTMGYAEGLLSLVKYFKIGKIIGSPTAGACGEIMSMNLPGGYSFSMTAAEGILPDGTLIGNKPVQPDIPCKQDYVTTTWNQDRLINYAMQMIGK